MPKAEERACQYTGYSKDKRYRDYLNGYSQAIEDTCEWIKHQKELLEDSFSDPNDFADLLKEAMKDE